MPPKKSRSSTASRRRSNKKTANPSVTALTYNGPTRLALSAPSNDHMTTQLNNTGQVASSGTGVINTVFDAYLQASSVTDWTNFTGLYQEFRILSMEVELIPWNKYNLATTTVATPLYSVTDRTSSSTLASAAVTVAYDSMKVSEPSTRHKRVIKMNGADEAAWTQTGATPASASRLYVKLYSAGNSNSVTYYDFVARILVQFRGRN